MGHYVYKYVLNGECLYIGKTDIDLVKRLKQHGVSGDNISSEYWGLINKADIYYTELVNATMSDVVESELIRRYKPKCNKAKMGDWSGIPFAEPPWIKFGKPAEWSRRVHKTKKRRILNDYYDSNCESRQNLLYVIEKMKHGDYWDLGKEMDDPECEMFGIDVTEIANDEDWFLNTSFSCDTHDGIKHINWASFISNHPDSDCKYVFVNRAKLKETVEESAEIFFLEEEKHMQVKAEGESA